MKKVLFLGAALHQTPIIKKAKDRGLYVITCDYLPDNPGHRYADESHDISTTDREKVLELAKRLKIDGIIAYASDVSAPTAAYVGKQLGLPANPLESVEILTDKEKFRAFLNEHDFATPKAWAYSSLTEAIDHIDNNIYPVVVKPVDSSGSRGVNRVDNVEELPDAIREALHFSSKKRFVIEEFVNKQGYQISGDAFSVNGKLVFWSFGNEYCISHPELKSYIPMGECWPSSFPERIKEKVANEIQRLISLLGMQTGAYNIEAMIDNSENVYLMEVGPRNGGSMIPELIFQVCGVDLQEYTIRAALDEDCADLCRHPEQGYWANYNIPSFRGGRLIEVFFDPEFREKYVMDYRQGYNVGDIVPAFRHYHSNAVGLVLMKFQNNKEMYSVLNKLPDLIRVIVE